MSSGAIEQYQLDLIGAANGGIDEGGSGAAGFTVNRNRSMICWSEDRSPVGR
jgi:hypothetical protein